MQVKCEPVGLEKAENTELYTYTDIWASTGTIP